MNEMNEMNEYTCTHSSISTESHETGTVVTARSICACCISVTCRIIKALFNIYEVIDLISCVLDFFLLLHKLYKATLQHRDLDNYIIIWQAFVFVNHTILLAADEAGFSCFRNSQYAILISDSEERCLTPISNTKNLLNQSKRRNKNVKKGSEFCV